MSVSAPFAPSAPSAQFPGAVNLTASQVQFLEKNFAEWLGIAGLGSRIASLEADGLALLHWLHDRVFVNQQSIDAIRNELLASNGGLRVIAISSGKGGVGKTTCSVNLAYSLAANGHRVLLVDADLGLGNVHVFAGVNPTVTIQDFLENRVAIQDALTPVEERLWLLCGGSGVAGLADLQPSHIHRLLRHLRALKHSLDYLIVDTGAGLSPQVLGFLLQAQDIVIVTTPNIAATLDAYGLVKTIHERGMSGTVRLLVNQCKDEAEAHAVADKIQQCATHFLGERPELLGYLTRDEAVEECNQQRHPLVRRLPDSPNALSLRTMGARLANKNTRPRIDGGLTFSPAAHSLQPA